jgi:alkanesulfonate monooxygenase SsuD/methylene tetrahydromethanopterin reductase-like flavin-dependent oxidoreductase (luciferase family)
VSDARGFGVAAGLDSELAERLAGRCEELGYTSIWSNDHPAASGIETLADFARGSAAMRLGVGVLALDRNAPDEIDAKISECGLDRSRLVIGVGAGFSAKPLTRMREAHDELRERIPGVTLVLAAMGPKMCALAGSADDGAFFNWMTPAFAAGARSAPAADGSAQGARAATSDAATAAGPMALVAAAAAVIARAG